jgi:hypothetical protein
MSTAGAVTVIKVSKLLIFKRCSFNSDSDFCVYIFTKISFLSNVQYKSENLALISFPLVSFKNKGTVRRSVSRYLYIKVRFPAESILIKSYGRISSVLFTSFRLIPFSSFITFSIRVYFGPFTIHPADKRINKKTKYFILFILIITFAKN